MDFNERTQKFQNLERKVINVEPNELKVMPTEPPPQVYSTVPFNFPAIATAGIAVNGALAINQAVAMSQVRINEYIENTQAQILTAQQAYDEVMAENPEGWDWRISDRLESLKHAEIKLSIWKDLQTALDKMLCK